VSSSFGAAGSLITVLVWVYYSSLIFFLGAEFTKVYASEYGSGVVPAEHAQRIDNAAPQSAGARS
jgi:membrane protein